MAQRDLIQSDVRGKLASLKASISTRLAMEGAAWVVLVLAAAVAVTFALDFGFRLDDRGVRGTIVGVAMMTVLFVAWLTLARPLLVPMRPADLALLVERKFSQIGDRLISAIQLTGRRDLEAMGISSAMVMKMAEEANTLAAPLPFGEVVNRRGMVRAWGYALAAAAILLGFGVWRGDLMDRWFQRNVLFRNVSWPQSTYLRVVGGGDFSVLRGDDLTVTVEVEPNSLVLPSTVALHARYPSVGRTEERIDHDPDNPRRFTKTFQAVAEEFDFHVIGGDDFRDRNRKHTVRLVDPPSLRRVAFSVHWPSYMRRPKPEQIDGATPVLLVPVGAKVTVEAESTKDLVGASILLDGKPAGEMQGQKTGAGKPSRRQFVGAFDVEGANRPASMAMTFALMDTDGYINRHGAKYIVQVQPDLPPSLEARKVHVQAKVTASAIIPLNVKVKDDCGILGMDLVATLQAVPGKDANSRPVKLPPDVERTFEGTHELDLKDVAPGLKPGQTLYVGARAVDTLPKELSGPNLGYSGMIGLAVASDQEVSDDILTRRKRVTLELIQATQMQESARARTVAAKEVFDRAKDDPEGKRLLADSAGTQTSVGGEVAKAADALFELREEMKNNRVGTAEQMEQIQREMVEPLRMLGEPIQKIGVALRAAAEITDGPELARRSENIEAMQKEVRERLETVVRAGQKSENKQELANRLGLIIKWSEELLKALEEEKKIEIKRTLGTTQPTQPTGNPK
jgi:hypothetical protein